MTIDFQTFDGNEKLRNRDWNSKVREDMEQLRQNYLNRDKETKSLRVYKDWYTGDMDAFHEGPCCGGCIGEQELGYSGGGNYCCCYEGLTPLEQWNNPVKYPPVNGKIPQEFQYFGPRTAKRWIERFKNQLLPEELEEYYKWNPEKIIGK